MLNLIKVFAANIVSNIHEKFEHFFNIIKINAYDNYKKNLFPLIDFEQFPEFFNKTFALTILGYVLTSQFILDLYNKKIFEFRIELSDAYIEYLAFCNKNGLPPISKKNFRTMLEEVLNTYSIIKCERFRTAKKTFLVFSLNLDLIRAKGITYSFLE